MGDLLREMEMAKRVTHSVPLTTQKEHVEHNVG